MTGVFVFFALPFTWLICSAFDPRASPEFKIPRTWTLEWFAGIIKPLSAYVSVRPIDWIVNSLIISLATASLATLISVFAAFPLSRFRFRGQTMILNMMAVLRLIPTIVVVIPIVIIMKSVGLLNTLLGVILVITALILPFNLLIAESFFRAIPKEYEEAAMIDGLSRWSAFFRITLRLSLPGIATIWLLSFVNAWSEFLVPLALINYPWLYPASIGIYYWFGVYGRVEYGRISAFAIIYSIPVVIVFLLVYKYLERGIAGLVTR